MGEDARRGNLDIAKARDAWWTVLVVDPIAIPLTRSINRLKWITPNRLSALGAASGIASGILFLQGQIIGGAVLFEIRFLFDCMDGKLARLRGQSSETGAFLDLAADKALISWNYGTLAWAMVEAGWASPVLSTLVVGTYLMRSWLMVYMRMLNDRRDVSWEEHGMDSGSLAGRLRRMFARRRLLARPNSIDLENVACFVSPILFGPVMTTVLLWIGVAYYVAISAANAVQMVGITRET